MVKYNPLNVKYNVQIVCLYSERNDYIFNKC